MFAIVNPLAAEFEGREQKKRTYIAHQQLFFLNMELCWN